MSYGAVLRAPGARRIVALGFIGRAPMAMLPVGLVLAVVALSGSYGLGGLAAAAYTLASAFAGPWIGGRVDRLGQRRVGLPLLLVFGAAGATIVTLAAVGGPAWAFVPAAAVAGAAQPNVGSWTRSRWAHLLVERRARDSAQALESIIDETNFLIGPSAVALLFAAGPAWLPIAVTFGCGVVGTAGLLSLRGSEPPAHGDGGDLAAGRRLGGAPAPGFWLFLLALVGIGVALGGMTVVMTATAQGLGDTGYTALVFAVYSLASLIGAIVVGRMAFHGPAARRFIRSLVVYGLSLVPVAVAPGAVGFTVACFLAGSAIAPSFIQANAHVADVVDPRRRTEAFAWLGSAVGLGLAAGSAIVGRIVDLGGVDAARAAIVLIGFLPGLAALAWGVRTRADREAAPGR